MRMFKGDEGNPIELNLSEAEHVSQVVAASNSTREKRNARARAIQEQNRKAAVKK